MAGMRPKSQGFSDPFLPPVCFIFLPDLLTIEQSPPGPLGTRLSQPQVKQLAFPAWSKRESVQVQVRRWCTQLQSRWNVVCDTQGFLNSSCFLSRGWLPPHPSCIRDAWDDDVCRKICTAPDIRATWHKAQVLQFVTNFAAQGSIDVEKVGWC